MTGGISRRPLQTARPLFTHEKKRRTPKDAPLKQ